MTVPEPAGPPVLFPRRQPGRLGPLHVVQLLLVEIVLVAVAAALTRNAVLAAGVALAGAGVLGLGLSRRQGRWWLERHLLAREHRRRRRATANAATTADTDATDAATSASATDTAAANASAGTAPAGTDPRLAALRALAPGLTVTNVGLADGARVGVAHDDAGWYAVAALIPRPPSGDDPGGVPLDLLTTALAEVGQPGVVLQLVTQTISAPSIHTSPSSPAGQSYRRLLAGFGSVPVPADRETWLAVRLDARVLAEAVAETGADLDAAPTVVAALLRRVGRSLRHAGVAHRLLDADGLLGAIVRSCDLEPRGPLEDPPRAREEWSAWHSSLLAHRSFWIRQWPPPARASNLLDRLSTAPAAMTSVALIVVPDGDPPLVDLRGLVRVAAAPDQLAAVCEELVRTAAEAGAGLFPLDGEQGPASYASAPTGGHRR